MDLFEEIVRMRKAGQRGALATIVHTNGSIPSYESSRMLVREDGSIAGTIGGGCVEAEVWAAAKEVMAKESPRKMVFQLNNEASYDNGLICGGTLEVFVEPILPQPVAYIFGGGHISMALAKSAHAAGFGIVVIDDREQFANKERFPMAQEIFTSYRRRVCERIQPNASSYLVIVTRGHRDDMRVLAWAVRTDARYIGMIGSKRKVLSVYQALEKEGYAPEEFERVYAPMGLEIGALSPEEIAISIAAELIAVRRSAVRSATQKIAARSTARRSPRNRYRIALNHRRFMLAAVILSGGASRRMGSPKALVSYQGRPFLEHLAVGHKASRNRRAPRGARPRRRSHRERHCRWHPMKSSSITIGKKASSVRFTRRYEALPPGTDGNAALPCRSSAGQLQRW